MHNSFPVHWKKIWQTKFFKIFTRLLPMKGSLRSFVFIIHKAMLVGILYSLCGEMYFHIKENACLSEKVKSGLFIMSRLCSQKLLWKVFFFFVISSQDGKNDPADSCNKTINCNCYFALISTFIWFNFINGCVRSGNINTQSIFKVQRFSNYAF